MNPPILLDPYNRGLRRELLRTLLRMGQVEPAAAQLEAMLQSHADDPESLAELARIRVQLGQPDAAMDLYESSLSIQPAVEVRFELANLLRDQKRYAEAVEQYHRVLAEVPSPVVLNNLAWLLATASDDQVRNGGEALQLAQRACEVTSNKVPKMLGTLAAAYAEQGDFRSARHACSDKPSRWPRPAMRIWFPSLNSDSNSMRISGQRETKSATTSVAEPRSAHAPFVVAQPETA